MKRIRKFLLSIGGLGIGLGLWLAFQPMVLAAPTIPARPAEYQYVYDYAEALSSETISSINALGSEAEARTGAQLIVVTQPTIGEAPLEDYSLAILREWGIGQAGTDNGALLLVVTEDRRARLEIGYGLEGLIPDGKAGRILDAGVTVALEDGNFDQGILSSYRELVAAVIDETLLTEELEAADASDEINFTWREILAIIVVLILLVIDWVFFGGFFTRMIFIIISLFGGKGSGGGRGGFGGGSGGGGGASR